MKKRYLIATSALLGLSLMAIAEPGTVTTQDAISRLKQGQGRFIAGNRVARPNETSRRQETAKGQKPFASILTCADSRLSPEILFDQGLGDLFVVRVAGNVATTNEIGSLEYGVEHLGTNYLLVLGHSKCGAVQATVDGAAEGEGNIPGLLSNITSAVEDAQHSHANVTGKELVPHVIQSNVWNSVEKLLSQSEILRHAVSSGTLKIEGGVYDLSTGRVDWLGTHPKQATLLAETSGGHSGAAASSHTDSSTTSASNESHGGSSAGATTTTNTASGSGTNFVPYILCTAALIGLYFVFKASAVQNWLRNLAIAKKLSLGFGFVILGSLAVGLIGINTKTQIANEAEYIGASVVNHVDLLGMVGGDIRDCLLYQVELAEAKSKADVSKWEAALDSHVLSTNEHLASYAKGATEAEDKALIGKVQAGWNTQLEFIKTFESQVDSGNRAAALKTLTEARHQFQNEIEPAIAASVDWNHKHTDQVLKSLHATSGTGTQAIIIAILFSVSLGVLLAVNISRNLVKSVGELMPRLSSLANNCLAGLKASIEALKNGDLTVTVTPVTTPVDNPGNDEIGQMTQVFNTMLGSAQSAIGSYTDTQKNLSNMISQVAGEAKFVQSSSSQLSDSASLTSTAASEVAMAVEQMAQAITQGAETSTQIAEGSQNLANSASTAEQNVVQLQDAIESVKAGSEEQLEAGTKASTVAEAGGKAVNEAISSMTRIQSQVELSSQVVQELGQKQAQIGSIVQAIDEIAEQTNLLALNAAIEAARAGEHGRGFAVVAEEVRKLAERASQSTQEIGTIIEQISSSVGEAISAMETCSTEVASGAKHSAEASQALAEILLAISDVRKLAESNANQVHQMMTGVQSVNSAVASVANVSQDTAAAAEELSAGSEEMSASAEEITASVEEQTANIAEINRMSEDLASSAQRLDSLIATFKIHSGPELSVVTSKAA